jgi:beta-aspartyl-peptidase (threonine type)
MPDARPANRPEFVLAIHGGAGVIDRSQMSEELERAYRAALDNVLAVGRDVLAGGGRSIDAVVAAVTTLEDDPLFNAGRGAAFTAEGVNELDAAVMDGGTLKAGAVTLVTTVRNPVKLARLVMDETRHVLLAGHGAEALARLHGLDIVDPRYFHTERRWNALQRMRSAAQVPHAPAVSEAEKHGTVGAVALDRYGNLAAATSTGGRNNKLPGRVGDSPLIGAGTYASNATAAVSCTGEGEYFITTAAAYAVSALMEMKGATVEEAAKSVIHERLARAGGRGGLIALDAQGNIAMPFSTAGMYRGCARSGSASTVHIYK